MSRDKLTEGSIVQISGLKKQFGQRTVIENIDLDVARGEIVVIVGPSGTGKSTILRCINGLEDIQAGEICFEGRRVVTRGPNAVAMRRRIGMIFQNFNLYPHLTALGNITLGPHKILHRNRDDVEEHAMRLLRQVRLEHRAGAFPAQLSGGEQQRVAIARALAMNPSLLLFDEPTSALDPETVGDVLAVMEELAKEKRTMIVVTHEIAFARRVGSRLIFVDQGRIVEQGSPAELIESPREERTRQFFGSILRH